MYPWKEFTQREFYIIFKRLLGHSESCSTAMFQDTEVFKDKNDTKPIKLKYKHKTKMFGGSIFNTDTL